MIIALNSSLKRNIFHELLIIFVAQYVLFLTRTFQCKLQSNVNQGRKGRQPAKLKCMLNKDIS